MIFKFMETLEYFIDKFILGSLPSRHPGYSFSSYCPCSYEANYLMVRKGTIK